MDQTKPTRSRGKVAFSWENKPGVAKNFQAFNSSKERHDDQLAMKLPPPPCPNGASKWTPTCGDIQNIPLPPVAFLPSPALRSSASGKGRRKHDEDDPFLAAYQECTKGNMFEVTNEGTRSGDVVTGWRRVLVRSLSCKNSCGVRDGNLVRVSQLPSRE